MTLSTSWNPGKTFAPRDKRIKKVSNMISWFIETARHYGYYGNIQTVGSTSWLWLLKSSMPQNNWVSYYLNAKTDVDIRDITSFQNFYTGANILYWMGNAYSSQGLNTSSPQTPSFDYAQVSFLDRDFPVDWTITAINKAPLHNYDIFCSLENYSTVRFHLPNFPGASEALNDNKFLLNPKIFETKEGKPVLHYEEFEETNGAFKERNVNKLLSWVIKTICKITATGVSLADETLNYLNALANTPFTNPLTQNSSIIVFSHMSNGSILQSVLSSFYQVYYNSKKTTTDEKYILEQGLKRIKVTVKNTEQTLYQIFADTIKAEVFPTLEETAFTPLLKTDESLLSPALKNIIQAARQITAPTPQISASIPISPAKAATEVSDPSPFAPTQAKANTPDTTRPSYSAVLRAGISPTPQPKLQSGASIR